MPVSLLLSLWIAGAAVQQTKICSFFLLFLLLTKYSKLLYEKLRKTLRTVSDRSNNNRNKKKTKKKTKKQNFFFRVK